MKLKSIGANKTEVTINDNTRVLFSYETPVAARVLTNEGTVFYRTLEFYSRTTSKHINSWLPKEDAIEVDQSFFNDLVQS